MSRDATEVASGGAPGCGVRAPLPFLLPSISRAPSLSLIPGERDKITRRLSACHIAAAGRPRTALAVPASSAATIKVPLRKDPPNGAPAQRQQQRALSKRRGVTAKPPPGPHIPVRYSGPVG